MTQGTFASPGCILGSRFLTGKDAAMNGGVTISPNSISRSVHGTGWITVAEITYTPRSIASIFAIHFDDDYLVGGSGTDILGSRITVDGTLIAASKQQRFAFGGVSNGSGTRSNVILPISAIVKNTVSSTRTIRIQISLADCDDTLTLSLVNWAFELLESQS